MSSTEQTNVLEWPYENSWKWKSNKFWLLCDPVSVWWFSLCISCLFSPMLIMIGIKIGLYVFLRTLLGLWIICIIKIGLYILGLHFNRTLCISCIFSSILIMKIMGKYLCSKIEKSSLNTYQVNTYQHLNFMHKFINSQILS